MSEPKRDWEKLFRLAQTENKMLRARYDGDLVDRMRTGIVATESENARLRAVLSALCDAAATTVSGCVVLDRSAFESAVAAAVSVLQGEPE